MLTRRRTRSVVNDVSNEMNIKPCCGPCERMLHVYEIRQFETFFFSPQYCTSRLIGWMNDCTSLDRIGVQKKRKKKGCWVSKTKIGLVWWLMEKTILEGTVLYYGSDGLLVSMTSLMDSRNGNRQTVRLSSVKFRESVCRTCGNSFMWDESDRHHKKEGRKEGRDYWLIDFFSQKMHQRSDYLFPTFQFFFFCGRDTIYKNE